MYTRLFSPPNKQSFFLFGPRGVGKSNWLENNVESRNRVDLLDFRVFKTLNADPTQLETYILEKKDWVLIDEIQKVPSLLDEVHRLIEKKKLKFILTGSSARKLRREGVNLLAGRALTRNMYPLVAQELGVDFSFEKSLKIGHLPMAYLSDDPSDYLQSYLQTYLREEVQAEGFVRNLSGFNRFLEAASFSQAQYLNVSNVAADCGVDRKVVESYFKILEDILIAEKIPHFKKKSSRKTDYHPKFFYFDVGVFRTLRPQGPEDQPEHIEGAAFETLFYQEVKAMNSYQRWGLEIYCWKESNETDVDFVLYGKNAIHAFEIKRSPRIRGGELRGLKAFEKIYPKSKLFYLNGGTEERKIDGVWVLPMKKFIQNIQNYLS